MSSHCAAGPKRTTPSNCRTARADRELVLPCNNLIHHSAAQARQELWLRRRWGRAWRAPSPTPAPRCWSCSPASRARRVWEQQPTTGSGSARPGHAPRRARTGAAAAGGRYRARPAAKWRCRAPAQQARVRPERSIKSSWRSASCKSPSGSCDEGLPHDACPEYGQRCSRRAESYHPGAALAHAGLWSTWQPGGSTGCPPSVRLEQATWVGNSKRKGECVQRFQVYRSCAGRRHERSRGITCPPCRVAAQSRSNVRLVTTAMGVCVMDAT